RDGHVTGVQTCALPIWEAHPGVRTVLGAETIRELLRSNTPLDARLLDTVEVDPDEPCILQLSGGTTGVPKLIPRTNNDYVYNTRSEERRVGKECRTRCS